MTISHMAIVSMSLLLLISTVRSEPPELFPQSSPSDHGFSSQGGLTVSPAMQTFFKGTKPDVELPEAIDSAAIARASHVPQPDVESVSSNGGGEKRRRNNGAVIAGVVSGVAGLALIAVGVAVYKVRRGPSAGENKVMLGSP